MTWCPAAASAWNCSGAVSGTSQPALLRGRQPTLPSPPRRDPELRRRWGLGEQDIAVLRRPAGGEKNLGLLGGTFRALCAAASAAEAAPGTGGRRAERRHLERDLPGAVLRRPARRNPEAAHYASGRPVPSSSLSETTSATWSSKPRPPASRWSPSTRPPPASTSAMGTTACSPRRATNGFVEVASWLLDDQERLRRVRLNARQHASRQGWDSIVEHFQNYLEDACASPLVQPARSKPERPPAEDGGALPRSRGRSQAKAFGAAMKPRLMAPAPRLMPPVGLSMPRCKWMSRSRQAFSSAAKPGRSRSAVGSPA